jgi:hypothetical protein
MCFIIQTLPLLFDSNNSIDTSNASVIGSTSTASRQIHLGLKLVF